VSIEEAVAQSVEMNSHSISIHLYRCFPFLPFLPSKYRITTSPVRRLFRPSRLIAQDIATHVRRLEVAFIAERQHSDALLRHAGQTDGCRR